MNKSTPVFETEENGVGKCPDCAVEVGTVFDGNDCTVTFLQTYANEDLAREAEAFYTQTARSVESEPCQISSSITPSADGFTLDMTLVFCCQTEKVIFQLKQR